LNGRMIGEWRIGKDLEASIVGLFEVLYWHLYRGTEPG
jgi:hypothetical protein